MKRIDLHGKSVKDALVIVERSLDQARQQRSADRVLKIVHGSNKGVAIRESLHGHLQQREKKGDIRGWISGADLGLLHPGYVEMKASGVYEMSIEKGDEGNGGITFVWVK